MFEPHGCRQLSLDTWVNSVALGCQRTGSPDAQHFFGNGSERVCIDALKRDFVGFRMRRRRSMTLDRPNEVAIWVCMYADDNTEGQKMHGQTGVNASIPSTI